MPTYKKSYRLSKTCLKKIDELVELENVERKRFEDDETTPREIIEHAIDYFYALKIQKAAGDPLIDKLEMSINNIMKVYMIELAKAQNAMNYTVQKNCEYTSLLLKSSKGLPVDEIEMKKMIYGISRFEKFVDNKLLEEFENEKE